MVERTISGRGGIPEFIIIADKTVYLAHFIQPGLLKLSKTTIAAVPELENPTT